MNILLWIAQVLLAVSLIWSSTMKLFQPADKLAEMWPWTVENANLVKLTGVLDFLAGIGLVFPSLLRIQPKLTIYAAYGTIALMIAAGIFHIVRGEASQIGVNIFFAVFAVFIVWGRLKKAPITPKP
ncbi:DoxX family protein [Runella sp.]|uniref:DoxX family protein n=1 Tax=Runella sp. TaxID=1960881 RepID=UPI003D0A05EC